MAEVDLWQWDNDRSHLEGVTNCEMSTHFICCLQHGVLKCFLSFMQRDKNRSVILEIA